jgi:very-short-patch-repair endonuclease
VKTFPDRRYLTEPSLGRFLRQRIDENIVSNRGVPGMARRFQPDFRSEQHRLIVEFDGDDHYRSVRRIFGDRERDAVLSAAGYQVVRVPYFVQLTQVVIANLFGQMARDHRDFLNFPHGFIAPTVVMPADFCELGIARFEDDLERFAYIRGEILDSLKRAVTTRDDWRLVYPPSRVAAWRG